MILRVLGWCSVTKLSFFFQLHDFIRMSLYWPRNWIYLRRNYTKILHLHECVCYSAINLTQMCRQKRSRSDSIFRKLARDFTWNRRPTMKLIFLLEDFSAFFLFLFSSIDNFKLILRMRNPLYLSLNCHSLFNWKEFRN